MTGPEKGGRRPPARARAPAPRSVGGCVLVLRKRGLNVTLPSQASHISRGAELFIKLTVPSPLLFNTHKTRAAQINLNFRRKITFQYKHSQIVHGTHLS